MSTARRAYNLLRAYINREWERIEDAFRADAERELEESLHPTLSNAPPQPATQETPQPKAQQEDEVARAYRILGLPRDATLAELKRKYRRLSERSLPTQFPEGSEERRRAAKIHLMVQEAYDTLLPILDPRIRRFRNLDLD
jgi:DnaJ-class molecular chaperone